MLEQSIIMAVIRIAISKFISKTRTGTATDVDSSSVMIINPSKMMMAIRTIDATMMKPVNPGPSDV